MHQTLVTLVPTQTAAADAVLTASLAQVPAGPDRDRGLAAGRAAATALITERTGDGLDSRAAPNRPLTPQFI